MIPITSTTSANAADSRNSANAGVLGAAQERSSRQNPYLYALTHGRGLIGTILIVVVILAGLFAPIVAPFAPDQQIQGANLLGPSSQHWLGTDAVNRDLLSRTLFGIRVNLIITFIAVPIGAIIGCILGLVSATWRFTDTILQRSFDLLLAFPTIILGIALTVILGPGLTTVFIVVVLAEIPVFGRLMRSQALRVRELAYVDSASTFGAGRLWILRHHILPNSIDPLLVQLTIAMSVGVFIEGAMSFLGIGVTPPTPSLGSLINEGAAYAYHAPFFAVGPLLVVIALTLGLMLISQSLSRRIR
ncbi:ABC transporter permease [Corynebacterium crudilactis]|uniref:Peptide ABC transporter permease n=1 Tax=Corynebacterium crudilactis TaxID=1652495 RepID=A0A172QWJ3_9CORY|nr:ABC transporter permease [Corynebacterium crudilactis]ANE05016.1 peptide ABC transporter permease [Corynebacterium crudilactis]